MQGKQTIISKKPLREDIHALLRDRIVAGTFPPGSRLQDVQVAGELRVSRTPVREALLRLAREGLVESDPNRGFFVAQLSRKEILEIYPIVWALECLALNSSKPPAPPQQIQALRQINAEIAAAPADALRCQELDMRWHQTLVEPSGNQHLIDSLAGFKQLVRRYESVYMQDSSLVRGSIRDHNDILEALANKSTKLAGRLLEKHWRAGMESILSRLDGLGQTKTD
jgi:DNA-binding GntR family transcriptional regulator